MLPKFNIVLFFLHNSLKTIDYCNIPVYFSVMKEKKYNNTKLAISVAKSVLSFILLLCFVHFGFSLKLVNFLKPFIPNNYILLLIYSFGILLGFIIIFFPIDFYSGYKLEHKYNLSNQSVIVWLKENLKGFILSLILGTPVLLMFYFIMVNYTDIWWMLFAIILFFFSVILAIVLPVFILPLFYKVTPIEDEELKEDIKKIASKSGFKITNVYKFDMSKNTKRANAALTGLGKSKRIILGDTLLESCTKSEIVSIVAHELGHYKHKHIILNIIMGTLSSFLTLFIISVLYKNSLKWFGFENLTDIAAFPLLALWGTLIGLIQTPFMNYLSRKFEYQADSYVLEILKESSSFISALKKLSKQNLSDDNPNPFVEWYFYSHPSNIKRINAIKYCEEKLKIHSKPASSAEAVT